MACTNCNSSAPLTSFDIQYFYSNQCFDCGEDACSSVSNSKCVVYTGPNLSCSGIITNDSIETALQKLDAATCAIVDDWSNFQYNCLTAWWGSSISTPDVFVDAMTGYACEIATNLATFTGTTFTAAIADINVQINDITSPGITCASAGITGSDSLTTVYTKYCNKFSSIDSALDISSVVWNNCFTTSAPTTIAQGFDIVLDQICQLQSASTALPTFDNSANCLAGTASDTLVQTINALTTKICATAPFDITAITWGCVTAQPNLQNTIQKLVSQTGILIQNIPTYSTDFVVTATDPMDPCAGLSVALATPLNQDRYVAVNALDATPGTLIDKLFSTGGTINVSVLGGQVSVDVADNVSTDITISSGGAIYTINDNAVDLIKMAPIGPNTILGNSAGGSSNPEEVTIGSNLLLSGGTLNTYGRTLIGVTVFTTSGTWAKPTGCNAVQVLVIGAGGGGAGADSAANCSIAGGGGSGSARWNFITSGLNATETVTIGTGGIGGVGNANGGNGGNTSFGAHSLSNGGGGGYTLVEGTTADFAPGGAAGSLSITGSATQVMGGYGSTGDYGIRLSGTMGKSGKGAASVIGGGGDQYSAGSGGDGAIAAIGASTGTGNSGSNGLVIVYEYS